MTGYRAGAARRTASSRTRWPRGRPGSCSAPAATASSCFGSAASGIPTTTPFYNLLRGYSSSLVYAAGRVFAQTGEVLDVSNPNAPFSSAFLGAQGPVALRDPQSLLN